MPFPSPTLHTNPFWSNSLEEKILLRTKLGLFPSEDSKKEELGKYLALKICAAC
jgi:hypothetical protein